MWRATVFTLFPAMFPGPLGLSLAGEALARGLWACEAVDIRPFGRGRHRAVDDTPAGGGPGMVMRADVLAAALDASSAAGRSPAAPADEPARAAAAPVPRARPGPGAGRRAALRPLRGRRRAPHRGTRARGGLDRRFRAVGRRNPGAGAPRRLRAPDPGRHGQGRSPAPKRVSRTGCSNIRTTPARAISRARSSPPCCSAATMLASPPGAAPRPSGSPASAGRTC